MRDHSTPTFTGLADLASARVGGRAVATNDDFFAPKANLVKPGPAVWIPDKYTSKGKWMDGWESRRRRVPGHDWCIVQLGMRGIVHGVNVDTSHFTGNYPSHCSIEAVDFRGALKPSSHATEGAPWTTILEKSALRGNGVNYFAIADRRPWTHLRLSIYPDGGVARLRAYGEVSVDWKKVAPGNRVVDLASITNGGLFLDASDTHYGTRGALIMPQRAKNMGDGWETKRRRGPGYDWAIVRLGVTGNVSKVEIDTNHYKGNYPDRASLEGCLAPGATVEQLRAAAWSVILPETKLSANKRHYFSEKQLQKTGPVSHVRLNIFPDGGVSRLRVHGRPSR
ncbi:MAG TPA: allantoicase [Gemmatimonadaceae bacterium]|nr:allantoicase [Gemmatimonadaceae bacterium]